MISILIVFCLNIFPYLSFCGAYAAEASTSPAKTVSFRLYAEPQTLDWHHAVGQRALLIIENVMEGLFSYDAQNKIINRLATSWELGADGTTYTFHLREAKWSDGKPLVASDFIASWRRLLTPKTGSEEASVFEDVEGASAYYKGESKDFAKVGLKALNDRTLQIRLIHPLRNWHRRLASVWAFPMRVDLLEKYGEQWALPKNIVTLGPYKIARYEPGKRFVLERDLNYYGKVKSVEQATAWIVEEENTAIDLFTTGKLDIVPLVGSLEYRNRVKPEQVLTLRPAAVFVLGIVVTKRGVDNTKLRRAIAMAIDKKAFVQSFGPGHWAATRYTPPAAVGNTKVQGLPFDLKRAKDELKASGFSTEQRLKLFIGNNGNARAASEIVAYQLKKNLGLTVDITMYELKAAREARLTKASELYFTGTGSETLSTLSYMTEFIRPNNFSDYKNAAFDQLIGKARAAGTDQEERRFVEAAEKLLLEDVPVVPLYHSGTSILVNSRVQKFQASAFGIIRLADLRLNE